MISKTWPRCSLPVECCQIWRDWTLSVNKRRASGGSKSRVRPLSRSLGLSRRLRNPVGPVGGSTKRSLRMPKSPTVARGLLEEWVVVGAEEL